MLRDDWTKVLYPLYTLAFITGIPGCILLIVVILKNRSWKNATNMFILNMAVASLIFFLDYVSSITTYSSGNWVLGKFLCRVLSFVTSTSLFVASTSFAVIAVFRLALLLFTNHTPLPSLGIAVIIAVQWTAGAALCLPLAIFRKTSTHEVPINFETFEMSTITFCHLNFPSRDGEKIYRYIQEPLCLFVPFIIVITCTIVCTVRRFVGGHDKSSEAMDVRKHERTNILLCGMAAFFFAFALAYGIISIQITVDPAIYHGWNMQLTNALIGCALGINPWMYMLFDNDSRRNVRAIFCCEKPDNTDEYELTG